MVRLYDFLDVMLTVLKATCGAIAWVVTDRWDGQSPRAKVGSRTMCINDQLVGAGATIGPAGWLDMSFYRGGQPSITLEMVTTTYDRRDIGVYVEYAEMLGGKMYPRLRQRDRNAATVEYTPATAVAVIDLYRDRGVYCRIKSITNHGPGDVRISAWTKSLIRPLGTVVTTYDYVLIEED